MEQASGLDAFRENLRLQQVYSVFLRYGLDIILDRPGFLGSLRQSMQAWVWDLPKDLEVPELPTKIRLMMEELGPTYVKIGQIVSSQASTLPSEWQVELEKLQSNVPPFGEDEVRQILMEELNGTPEELFAEFSIRPLAAASTAQVHRAVLHDGTEVVVKLQRPGIRRQMKADIGILSNASRVFSRRIRSMQAFDLAGMVDEFGSNALLELNYVGEAYNAMRLAENLAGCPGSPHLQDLPRVLHQPGADHGIRARGQDQQSGSHRRRRDRPRDAGHQHAACDGQDADDRRLLPCRSAPRQHPREHDNGRRDIHRHGHGRRDHRGTAPELRSAASGTAESRTSSPRPQSSRA